MEPVFGADLDAAGREALVARVRARPHEYVAQEQVALSTAPVLGGRAGSSRATWRCAPSASRRRRLRRHAGRAHARRGARRDSLVVSMQRGGGSKDTWVLADGPVSAFTLLRPAGEPSSSRAAGASSRAASPTTSSGSGATSGAPRARCASCAASCAALASESDPAAAPGLPALLDALAVSLELPDLARRRGRSPARASASCSDLVRATEPARALRPTLAAAQRLAAVVRDRISLDTWRVPHRARARPRGARAARRLAARRGARGARPLRARARRVRRPRRREHDARRRAGASPTWAGASSARSSSATLLRTTLVETRADEAAALDAVLEVADSAITYRRRYLGSALAEPVLDLLLIDETNPRALVFQLARARGARAPPAARRGRVPQRRGAPRDRRPHPRPPRGRARAWRRSARTAARGASTILLAGLAEDLPALADALTSRYLSHAQPPRRLGDG